MSTPDTQPFTMQKNDDGTYYTKLETGEEFKGTAEEVIGKLAEAKVNTRRHYETKLQEATTRQPDVTPPPAVNEDEKNLQDYLLSQMAKGLKLGDANELVSRFSSIAQTTEAMENQMIESEFLKLCPDYASNEENTAKLLDMTKAIVGNSKPTAKQLQAAHALCVQTGVYKPLDRTTSTTGTPTPAPVLQGSAAAASAGTTQDFSKMKADDIRKAYFDAVKAGKS